MKLKDFAFYAISMIALITFVLLPYTYGMAPEEFMPGIEICKQLINSVDSYLQFL
ncbi:MAG: hypothetical protein OXU66_16045 [Gammaproteobacteria bacterium]|nr:hypothetical protein [Gammaproteobacteria bacterium]MDD9894268.1 hypothetical protein [Gammaproteobacteria bacterium]MDD9960429.1 hypothetical protein [Gammaproteobacteria bacterium]